MKITPFTVTLRDPKKPVASFVAEISVTEDSVDHKCTLAVIKTVQEDKDTKKNN